MRDKKLIVFDLDGTLTKSKSIIDAEMAELVCKLLENYKVAVITGGAFEQIEKQFLHYLTNINLDLAKQLYLFPTSGAAYHKYSVLTNSWECVYREKLQPSERGRIRMVLGLALKENNFAWPTETYGEIIEDRKTQITFSALGQKAPVELKEKWDPDYSKRKAIKASLEERIPEYEVRIGGKTSIDITRKGIDKGYGVKKMLEHNLVTNFEEMLFIGDALFEGGNDYAVLKTGVECLPVTGPDDTKKLIRDLLSENL